MFEAIERAGQVAGLVGRSLRVPGASPAQVREVVGTVQAKIYTMPATLEERFLELTQPAAVGGRET